jgi:DNA-binding response OmpR family regulator
MPTLKTGTKVLSRSSPPPVLSISPDETDHYFLQKTIAPSSTLIKARTLSSGLIALRENPVALVLCECDLHPGTWKDILARMQDLPFPPHLIVTSRLADETLWAEALNLGAYDVLAKPFEVQEVKRVAAMARQNWERVNQTAGISIPAQRTTANVVSAAQFPAF